MRIDLALQAGLAVKNAGPELTKLKKAAQQVEGIFVRDLLAAMRKGGGDSFGKGFGATVYRDMFDQSMSETLASRGAFGIGDLLFKQMSKGVVGQEWTKLALGDRTQSVDRKE